TGIETTEVLILAGQPYEKLISKDNKPLSEKEARHEQEKMDKELAHRQNLSAKERAKLEEERRKEREYIRELPDAFTFRMIGEEAVSGKKAWVIAADPRPGYKPKRDKAKLLTRVRGKIWV